MKPRTLFDKIWDDHVIQQLTATTALIYIDRHLLHEGNTPHAFEGLRLAGRSVRRPQLTIGTVDHVIPTSRQVIPIRDAQAQTLVNLFETNCADNGIEGYSIGDARQGIVHVIGPERGFTLPGSTLVCGDSHTSTHGAFGAWAFGIGISDVEHVLATQSLEVTRPANMRVTIDGTLPLGVSAKDLILALIGRIGTAGGTGHVIEFHGQVVSALSMEGRMTLCNMAIEAGARAGIIAPDQTTFSYLHGKALAPQGDHWDQAVKSWSGLRSDTDAVFDREVRLDADGIEPQVTWGTNPEETLPIGASVPDPTLVHDVARRAAMERSLSYMGLIAGTPLTEIPIDHVFIGSCTNSRLEDLRTAATLVRGRKVAAGVTAWVVPGSRQIKTDAEAEGLDRVFTDAGFDWRNPGCSMCLAVNEDHLKPGQRCASTSNRNFEGRQGRGGRTHLMSPVMAAAAALTGHLTDARTLS